MEKEFNLTKAQWQNLYSITSSYSKLSRGNNHYHLNNAITSNFVKNSSDLKIKSDLNNYFQKNSSLITSTILLYDKSKKEEFEENTKKIDQDLISQYLDCLAPLDLNKVKNEFLIFTALSKVHINKTGSDAFHFLEKNGLNLQDYFGEFLNSSTTSSLRFYAENISNFWFEFHEKNKIKPEQEKSILLIKSLYPSENVLTMDNIEKTGYYLNRIDKNQDTLEHLMTLAKRSKTTNMFKAIHKILKKYPPELYDQVKQVFEDKNSIQTTISHLEIVQYKIDPLSLNLSGYLKASEVSSFLMSFNEAVNSFMGKKFPHVKLFENSKNHEFNFVTENSVDNKSVSDFVNNLDLSFQFILASYDKKQAPIKNTPILKAAMEKILFQSKLDDSLEIKDTPNKKMKI